MFLPEYVALKQPYTDLDKLRSIAHAGHELKHSSDSLTRPNFKMQNEKPYKKGHHFKEIYEPTELVKEVKELASDPKLEKEILKQSKKSGIKASPFTKLRSLLGFLPSLAAAGIAAYSPQSKAAQVPSKVLEEGDPMSFIFPSEAGEGEEEEIRKMYEEAKKRKIE
jgi:hypothetical protein